MFILYAIPVGIIAGFLLGGRLDRLGELRLHWAWLAVAGLVVQLLLFTDPIATSVADLGPPIYVLSTAAVLVAVVRNWRIPGMWLVALGAASNLLAIVANGGIMPASPEAVSALEPLGGEGFSNSVVVADPALRPLTDIFALPPWLPFANVFSIGDVFLGVGIAIVIASAMRRDARPAEPAVTTG